FVEGQIVAAQLYYLALHNGLANLIALGEGEDESLLVPQRSTYRSDVELEALVGVVLTGTRTGVVLATKTVVLWRLAAYEEFYLYLGNTSRVVNQITSRVYPGSPAGKTLKSIGVTDPLQGLWSNFKHAFGKHVSSTNRATGWAAMTTIAIGVIGAALYLSGKPGAGSSEGGDATRMAAAILLSVATTIVMLNGPIKTISNTYKTLTNFGFSKTTTVKALL